MTASTGVRHLVPNNRIIVVLDTAPVRNLAYAAETPQWVATFERMAQEGYSFSLADGALAELIAQRRRDALSAEHCEIIVEQIKRFLNLELPVLLGKIDISGMLGINDKPWSAHESRALSLAGWEMLKRCADPKDEQHSPEWALQDERDDWRSLFDNWQKILDEINAEEPSEEPINVELLTPMMLEFMERDQKQRSSLEPPMSVRMHLQNRYYWRQFVRKQKKKVAMTQRQLKSEMMGLTLTFIAF